MNQRDANNGPSRQTYLILIVLGILLVALVLWLLSPPSTASIFNNIHHDL